MDKSYEELKVWAQGLDAQEVFDFSTNQSLSGIERSIAYQIAKKLQSSETPSYRQLKSLDRIYSKLLSASLALSDIQQANNASRTHAEALDIDIKHLCLRMAWHDNKWNGTICKKPTENDFCVGEYSLLSDRIRRRRDLVTESKLKCSGCKADVVELGEYQPPCFWSINTFGEEALKFKHDNPIAPDFPTIDEMLPPYSIISWPFKLSFVKGLEEKKKYGGNYYPKEIFENRISLFQRNIRPADSVVFTYCNYSNPISGEEMKYLVTGCALLAEQGAPQFFDITADTLAKKARQLHQPNFPTMNWALRYTLDFEGTGIRIPYHEYLESQGKVGGIGDDLLEDIAVTIDEPELRDGFTYVAKHVDDDQAIYLLTKMRRSLLKVKEHGIINLADTEQQLRKAEELIAHTWGKRGYLPGLKSLFLSMPSVKENYEENVTTLIESEDLAAPEAVKKLRLAFAGQHSVLGDNLESLLSEIQDFMDEHDLSSENLLRLASLNLTSYQFARISRREGIDHSLLEICENPYLLFEMYEPGEDLEAPLSGEKIDGFISLFKIDISLLPLAKYQSRIKELHDLKVTDPRRLRAVVIEILQNRENSGDCFLNVDEIVQEADAYSLFYKADTPYIIEQHLKEPDEATVGHFQKKLVVRRVNGRVYYYLKTLFDDEVFIRDFIGSLVERPDHATSLESLKTDLPTAIKRLSKKIGPRFDASLFQAERERLYKLVASKSFFVITGLPGAGKSYELLKLVKVLNSQSQTYVVVNAGVIFHHSPE